MGSTPRRRKLREAGAQPEAQLTAEQARIRAIIAGVDVPRALKLEGAIDKALTEFEREHEALVQATCAVPGVELDGRGLVHCAFLGSILARLERAQGRLAAEKLVATLLEQFETARQQVGSFVGPGQ